LRFDAATHWAAAWDGDTQVVEHEGSYTPFEALSPSTFTRARRRADSLLTRSRATRSISCIDV
jgi:hypothetical protein